MCCEGRGAGHGGSLHLYATSVPQGSVEGGGCKQVKISFTPPKGERVSNSQHTTLQAHSTQWKCKGFRLRHPWESLAKAIILKKICYTVQLPFFAHITGYFFPSLPSLSLSLSAECNPREQYCGESEHVVRGGAGEGLSCSYKHSQTW